MNILFRTSAGSSYGWGNLYRILTIFYDIKKKLNFDYLFLVNGNYQVKRYLNRLNIQSIVEENFDTNIDHSFLINKKFEILIIETPLCNLKLMNYYNKFISKIIVLDDVLKFKYNCDVLVSCQENRKNKNIKLSRPTQIYNSYKYFPFKRIFLNERFRDRTFLNKTIKIITVFLGGSSYFNENLKILEFINKYNGKIKINLILSNELNNLKKIKLLTQYTNQIISNDNRIPHTLIKSDLVICGGGYTKIESAFLKCPIIIIPIHHHQINLTKNFSAKFKTINTQIIQKLSFSSFKKNIEMANFVYRKNCIRKFLKYFSNEKVNRISSIIEKEIIDFNL